MTYNALPYQHNIMVTSVPKNIDLPASRHSDIGPDGVVKPDKFKWWRHTGGWEIIYGTLVSSRGKLLECDANGRPLYSEYLVPNNKRGQRQEYFPDLEGKILLTDLPEKPSMDDYKAFYNIWGPLLWHYPCIVPLNAADVERFDLRVYGESELGPYVEASDPLSSYSNHAVMEAMSCFKVYSAISEGRFKYATRHFMDEMKRRGEDLYKSLSTEGINEEGVSEETYEGAAKMFFSIMLNTLIRTTRKSNYLSIDYIKGADPEFRYKTAPDDLLGYMVLQFVEQVVTGTTLRNCSVCSRTMAIKLDKRQSGRLFCSDACKMRAYRARKKATKE